MPRPITLFTGQWADLPFEEVCRKAAAWGYDGLEIACWGDHLDVRRAASDASYVREKKKILEHHELGCWAIGAHLAGQCVGDEYDPRLDGFAPAAVHGKPEALRAWAVEEMKAAAKAARALGCGVVTGFMGSPIWKAWYSFPPTPEEMVEAGFRKVRQLWDPIFDVFDAEGVRFGLEVHPTEIAFDVHTTRRLLATFDRREALGLNFDPSHLVWQGVEPHLFIREFADRIYHVHMKDAAVTLDGTSGILGSFLPFGDVRRGWNFRSLGHGDVDFESLVRELNAIGYGGPFSVEWEDNGMDREAGAPESLEFLRAMAFAPSGAAFDKTFGPKG